MHEKIFTVLKQFKGNKNCMTTSARIFFCLTLFPFYCTSLNIEEYS